MRNKSKNSGYALLIVLLVLSISTVVLSSTANLNLAKVSKANSAHEKLQLKWGKRSCKDAVFKNIQSRLSDQNKEAFEIKLGELKFSIITSDENSKVNINTLDRYYSKVMLASKIRKLNAVSSKSALVYLTPAKIGEPYQSLDQVFRFKRVSQLVDTVSGQTANSQITCWSDGKLNFKKCSQKSLSLILNQLDESIVSGLKYYALSNPNCTLQDAIKSLKIKSDKTTILYRLLTDKSKYFGAWVVANAGSRKYYNFYIVEKDHNRIRNKWGFSWD